MNNQNIQGADEMMAKLKAAQAYLKNDAPIIIGIEAEKHFKANFDRESFDGSSKWATRDTKRKGGTNGQKVLSKTGDLKNSIVHRVEGNTVIISSDLPYSQIHNEGLEGKAWGKHKFVMKKRQFIGESPELFNKLQKEIEKDLAKVFGT